jgi:hypothetical protein
MPVNTLEWIGMVAKYANLSIGGSNMASKAGLLRHLDQMMASYNEHPDVESYATEAPAKRLRRRSNPKEGVVEDDGYDSGLKIGSRRLTAMRSFLSNGTASGFAILREHLLFVGDVRQSVISDDVLMKKWFYAGSLPPKDDLTDVGLNPDQPAAANPESFLPKGVKYAAMDHDAALSPHQFDLMLIKGIKIFELETAHLDRDDLKAKCRPKEETWLQYRKVVQQWDLSMGKVAEADLSSEDYSLLEEAILRSRTMDMEVLSMLARRPSVFHIGMLPTCCTQDMLVDETAKAVQQAHSEATLGKLKVFEAELRSDWAMLAETHQGSLQLKELLKWLELEHRRTQTITAQALVNRYMGKIFPVFSLSAWKDMPGQLALMAKAWDAESPPKGPRRAVILVDFNTPHSRDSLRLPGLISALASTCKVLGPTQTIVMAWMPNVPREGSTKSAEQDEADIVAHCTREGFQTNHRVRMFFHLHPNIANKTSEFEWWADGRLMTLGGDNFWLQNSELARIRRVLSEPVLPHTKDLVNITSLSANEDITSGEDHSRLGSQAFTARPRSSGDPAGSTRLQGSLAT